MSLIKEYLEATETRERCIALENIFGFLKGNVESNNISLPKTARFLSNLIDQYLGGASPLLMIETEIGVSGLNADEWLLNKFDNFG